MDVVVVGDINADLILSGLPSLPELRRLKFANDMKLTLGGSSAIVAVNLARLGAATGFIGKVGKDLLGDFLIDTLKSAGVDTSRVLRDNTLPTGICVSMPFPTDYAMVSYPGIRNAFDIDDIDTNYLQQARHLHLSSFYLLPGLQRGCLELFRLAKSSGMTTSLDPDHDPQEQWGGGIQELLHDVDFFLPNELEAHAIAGTSNLDATIERLSQLGAGVVIKRGQDGAIAVRGSETICASAFKIEAVDTTGAGDSFNAGFLFQFLHGEPLQQCLVWGNACGALSTRKLGGIDSFPSQSGVEAFLAERITIDSLAAGMDC